MKSNRFEIGQHVLYSKVKAGGYWDNDFKAIVIGINEEKQKVKIRYGSKEVWVKFIRIHRTLKEIL